MKIAEGEAVKFKDGLAPTTTELGKLIDGFIGARLPEQDEDIQKNTSRRLNLAHEKCKYHHLI